jgi:hypothetical protein
MSRRVTGWRVAAAALGILALATLAALPPGPRTAPPAARPAAGAEARGVFHIHTTRSDGGGTVDDVAAAARRAGLQFVILADHGDAAGRPDPPAYLHGVLCIDAVEISTTGGHYAALGMGQAPYPLGGEARDVVEDVHRLGGFGVVAHPLSPRRGLRWTDWQAPFDAVEWLNGDSMWRDAPWPRLALAAWTFAARPAASLTSLYRRPAALDRAAAMTGARRVVLLAGADVHSRLGFRKSAPAGLGRAFLPVPSYEDAFGVATLRVRLPALLRGDARADADTVVGAIRAGHLHTVVDGLARPASFECSAASGGVTAGEGDRLLLAGTVTVRVEASAPAGSLLVLFDGAREVGRSGAGRLVYAGNRPGAYRAEVWLPASGGDGWLPWIVGNPIYVGTAEPPTVEIEPARPTVDVAVDMGERPWRGASSGGSRAEVESSAAGATLRYALAAASAPGSVAALVFGGTFGGPVDGLAFAGQADRPMRILLRVRAEAGGAESTVQRSVYLDQTMQGVMVPVRDMRQPDGTPAPWAVPPRVRELRFMVDPGRARPGAGGRFTIARLRAVAYR